MLMMQLFGVCACNTFPFQRLGTAGNLRSRTFIILGAVAKLRKATVSFVMPVCPSDRMEQLGSHRTDFHEIWYFCIFRKYV
jgi:hypothetical protein